MSKKLIIRNTYVSFSCGDTIGLGDYIKGSLYLYNLSKKLDFTFKINFKNHIINKYLISNDNVDISPENIPCYTSHDHAKLIELINNKILLQKNTNEQLELNILTNHFIEPKDLTDDDFKWFKDNFKPNDFINDKIKSFLKEKNLEENDFDILHIRSGDPFIRSNIKIDDNTIFDPLNDYITELPLGKKCLLISDYEKLGEILNKNYSRNFVISNSKPIHSGTGTDKTDINDFSNTLIELFLVSYAKNIYNFSIYQYPSNFSFWIGRAYKKNYKYTQIINFATKVIKYLILKLSIASSQNNIDIYSKLKHEINQLFLYDVLSKSNLLYLYNNI